MKNQLKILAIIYRRSGDRTEFVALKTSPEVWDGRSVWYVVTGSLESSENNEQALRREIKEETGLERIVKIIDLKTCYKYKVKPEVKRVCEEYAYLVEVKDAKIKLSFEHVDYKWLSGRDFAKVLDWHSDKHGKQDLKRFINMAEQGL